MSVAPREVPQYRAETFRDGFAPWCVCVFVLNENGRLLRQLEAMQPSCAGLDVVVADGGSTDGSTESEGLRARGVHTLLVKHGPGRLGAQMRMAFDWALLHGYRSVVVMDGNEKDGADALPRFVAKLDRGADYVQGSRFLPGGRSVRLPVSRWLGLRLVHAPLVSLAARRRFGDTTNGFRAYSRRLLEDPRVSVFRNVFTGYELHYYLTIRAARLGFTIADVPVSRSYPAQGKIPTKISPIRGNLNVLGCLARAVAGAYDP